MRGLIILMLAVVSIASCAVEAPAPAPERPAQWSIEPGRRAVEIQNYCQGIAVAACPRLSVYCESYQRSYIRTCMIDEGVPPDYVFLLTN